MIEKIVGMVVTLTTATGTNANTDDPVHLGIFGTGGGGEFDLNIWGFDDRERGDITKYWFGDVAEGSELVDARKAAESEGLEWNSPMSRFIGMPVDTPMYVYLRKWQARDRGKDDAWLMQYVKVKLYGDQGRVMTFIKEEPLWLAAQYGLIVWIPKVEDNLAPATKSKN